MKLFKMCVDDNNDDEGVREYINGVYVKRRKETIKNAIHWTFTWKKNERRSERERREYKEEGKLIGKIAQRWNEYHLDL